MDIVEIKVFVDTVYKVDMEPVGPNWGRNSKKGWHGGQGRLSGMFGEGGLGRQFWYVEMLNGLNITKKVDMMDQLVYLDSTLLAPIIKSKEKNTDWPQLQLQYLASNLISPDWPWMTPIGQGQLRLDHICLKVPKLNWPH